MFNLFFLKKFKCLRVSFSFLLIIISSSFVSTKVFAANKMMSCAAQFRSFARKEQERKQLSISQFSNTKKDFSSMRLFDSIVIDWTSGDISFGKEIKNQTYANNSEIIANRAAVIYNKNGQPLRIRWIANPSHEYIVDVELNAFGKVQRMKTFIEMGSSDLSFRKYFFEQKQKSFQDKEFDIVYDKEDNNISTPSASSFATFFGSMNFEYDANFKVKNIFLNSVRPEDFFEVYKKTPWAVRPGEILTYKENNEGLQITSTDNMGLERFLQVSSMGKIVYEMLEAKTGIKDIDKALKQSEDLRERLNNNPVIIGSIYSNLAEIASLGAADGKELAKMFNSTRSIQFYKNSSTAFMYKISVFDKDSEQFFIRNIHFAQVSNMRLKVSISHGVYSKTLKLLEHKELEPIVLNFGVLRANLESAQTYLKNIEASPGLSEQDAMRLISLPSVFSQKNVFLNSLNIDLHTMPEPIVNIYVSAIENLALGKIPTQTSLVRENFRAKDNYRSQLEIIHRYSGKLFYTSDIIDALRGVENSSTDAIFAYTGFRTAKEFVESLDWNSKLDNALKAAAKQNDQQSKNNAILAVGKKLALKAYKKSFDAADIFNLLSENSLRAPEALVEHLSPSESIAEARKNLFLQEPSYETKHKLGIEWNDLSLVRFILAQYHPDIIFNAIRSNVYDPGLRKLFPKPWTNERISQYLMQEEPLLKSIREYSFDTYSEFKKNTNDPWFRGLSSVYNTELHKVFAK